MPSFTILQSLSSPSFPQTYQVAAFDSSSKNMPLASFASLHVGHRLNQQSSVAAAQTNFAGRSWSYFGMCPNSLFRVLTAIMKFSWYLQRHTFRGNWLLKSTCFGLSSLNLLRPILMSGLDSLNIAYTSLIVVVRCRACNLVFSPFSLRMVTTSFLPGAWRLISSRS